MSEIMDCTAGEAVSCEVVSSADFEENFEEWRKTALRAKNADSVARVMLQASLSAEIQPTKEKPDPVRQIALVGRMELVGAKSVLYQTLDELMAVEDSDDEEVTNLMQLMTQCKMHTANAGVGVSTFVFSDETWKPAVWTSKNAALPARIGAAVQLQAQGDATRDALESEKFYIGLSATGTQSALKDLALNMAISSDEEDVEETMDVTNDTQEAQQFIAAAVGTVPEAVSVQLAAHAYFYDANHHILAQKAWKVIN